jgi:hypothetical protein
MLEGRDKTYILLNSSLLDPLEQGLWHGNPSDSGIKPTHKDSLDQVILSRVHTIPRQFRLTRPDKPNLIKGGDEIVSEGCNIPDSGCADKILDRRQHSLHPCSEPEGDEHHRSTVFGRLDLRLWLVMK